MIGLLYNLCVAAAGACVGSFCANAAIRSVRGEPAISGRSACDGCGVRLGYGASLPIVSFIQRAGRCDACRCAIDVVHALGELAGVLIAVSAFIVAPAARALLLATMGFILLASALVDIKSRQLPDRLTLLVLLLAVVLAALSSLAALALGCACGAATFALLWTLRAASRRWRGEVGLGLGDVKLAAALAVWLGLGVSPMIALGAGLALAWTALRRSGERRIPFGPHLALSAWIVGLLCESGAWPAWG